LSVSTAANATWTARLTKKAAASAIRTEEANAVIAEKTSATSSVAASTEDGE
jgi:hypothetical protein